MAEKKPVSYQDPYWQNLAANAEEKHGLPAGSLRTILTHGERSNANQVSEKGARTVFQIIPATRSAILKNYGIDAYLSDENAADGAALLFKEALNRNNNDPIMAAREYHGGTDRSNWGPVNRDYAKRYAEGLAAFRQSTGVNGQGVSRQELQADSYYDPIRNKIFKTGTTEPVVSNILTEREIKNYEQNKLTPYQKNDIEGRIESGQMILPPKETIAYDETGKPFLQSAPRSKLTPNPTEIEQAGQQIIDEGVGVASGVAGIAKDILSLPVGGVAALGQGVYDLAQNKPTFNAKESLAKGFGRGVDFVQSNLPGDSQASPTLNDVINAFPGAGSIETQLAMRGSAARGVAQEQRAVNNVLQKAAIADKPLTDKGIDFVVGSGGVARQPYAPPVTQMQGVPSAAVAPTVGAADTALPRDINIAQKIGNKTGLSQDVKFVYDPETNSLIDSAKIAEDAARGKLDVAPWVDKVDLEALNAANKLNVEPPVSAILSDKNAQTVAATAKSLRGDVYGAEQQYVEDLSRAASRELSALGAADDASAVDTIVKNKLQAEYDAQKTVAKNIFEGSKDAPSIIASPEFRGGAVDLSPLIGAIKERRSTGKNISPYFDELEKKIVNGTLRTFEDVKTEATRLNLSKFDANHPNINTYEDGLISSALRKIKQNYADSIGVGDEMRAANEATKRYKNISDQMDDLFGYGRDKSLWSGLDTAFSDLSNGKPQKFAKLIDAVPQDTRNDVILSGVLRKFSSTPENFNFSQYNKWWNGIAKNSESMAALKNNIGQDGTALLHDVYKASRRMVEASKEFISTGAIGTVQKTFNDANARINSFGSKLMQLAMRGGLTELGSTLAGLPGAGVAATAATAQMSLKNRDLLRSVDKLLASQDFKSVLVDVARGRTAAAKTSLTKMPQINDIAKNVGQKAGDVAQQLVTPDKPAVARAIANNGKRYVKINNTTREPVTYRIVEASELQPSKKSGDNQPRDRERISSLAQVQSIANNLNYDELGVFPLMNHGAPVLASDGKTIVAGNGRAMGIKRAYDIGKADDYKSQLSADLQNLGIKDDITKYKNPVLVRQFDNDVDIKKYARQSNEGGGAMRMSKQEEAVVDASRLPKNDLLYDSAGNVDTIDNMPHIREWVNQYPIEERAALTTANGRLSAEGVARLKNALVHTAYGDTSVLRTLTENADEGGRNMFMALKNNADIVASVKNGIKDGKYYSNDISADIVSAVDKINTLKENGMTVKDYMQQAQMFDDGMSDVARELMQLFADNQRSPKKLFNIIREYYNVLMNRGSPTQVASMFDEAPVTSLDLLNIAKKKVEDKQ